MSFTWSLHLVVSFTWSLHLVVFFTWSLHEVMTLTWRRGFFDRSCERYSLEQLRPPLLRDGEESRVVWLVLVEIIHHNAHKYLEAKIHTDEDEDVNVDKHVLHM